MITSNLLNQLVQTADQSTADDDQPQDTANTIDVHKLADKVYRLMQAEIRLARARGERITQRRKR